MKPLVFVHGFLGSSEEFQFNFKGFQNHAYQIPGHNFSKILKSYDLDSLAQDLEVFLKDIPPPIIWGYSLGGRILQKLIQRGHVHLSGVILESAGFGSDSAERIKRDQHWAQLWEKSSPTEFLGAWYSQELFQTLKNHPKYPELLEIRKKTLTEAKEHGAPIAPILLEASPAKNPLPLPNTWSLPTLVLVGEKDLKYSQMWSPWIDKQSNLDIKILKNTGHSAHMESPDQVFHKVQSWLQKQTR